MVHRTGDKQELVGFSLFDISSKCRMNVTISLHVYVRACV